MPSLLRRALAIALTCCVAMTSWGGAYVPCDDVGADATTNAHSLMGEMAEMDMPGMPGMSHHGAPPSDAPCDHASHSSGHQDATTGTCQLGLHCVAMTMVADVPLSLDAPPRNDTPLAWPASVLRNHVAKPEAPPPKA
ncbi:MAG: hypothetical protein IPJ56_06710 [Gemmatimonadetes bacterium]|nr:hypothetical protein [Gemmatimonadota bacterium]